VGGESVYRGQVCLGGCLLVSDWVYAGGIAFGPHFSIRSAALANLGFLCLGVEQVDDFVRLNVVWIGRGVKKDVGSLRSAIGKFSHQFHAGVSQRQIYFFKDHKICLDLLRTYLDLNVQLIFLD